MKTNHQLMNLAPSWEVKHLFIGTFNPEGGTPVKYFYGRQRNRTWELLSEIFKQEFKVNSGDFFEKIKKEGIACIDLIRSVEFDENEISPDFIVGKGYSDSKIINNHVTRVYNTATIHQIILTNPAIKIYSTWGVGSNLEDWRNEVAKINNLINLVSPSMAARVPKGEKKYAYMLRDWSAKINLNR